MLGIYKDKSRKFPIDNYFDVINPTDYTCHIKEYSPSHSYLVVSVLKETKYLPEDIPFRLDFSSVLYYEGPFRWHGANFTVAQPDECLRLLRGFEEYEPLTDTTLLEHYVLFTVNTPNFLIKILAAQGYFVKVQPHDLL